jgi:dihydrofolate reductase
MTMEQKPLAPIAGPSRIEGFAIVSEDGMLANAACIMPAALKLDADRRFFESGLDTVDAVAHGRHSHERQPHSPLRRRLILTRQITALAPDKSNDKALFWNPDGASLSEAWSALGLNATASLGVIGGTSVFALFLDAYDAFHLSRAAGVTLPGGRPVFPPVPQRTPEDVLAAHGLAPGPLQMLDAEKGVSVVSWRR